jgi:HEAT repeat protein
MQTLTRTLGLFAPLLVTVAVAVGVVLAVLHATEVLVALAVATALLCVLAVVLAVTFQTRPRAQDRQPGSAGVRRAVARVVRSPEEPTARRDLEDQLDDVDGIRAVAEQLLPAHRETVRRVLLEVGAADRLREVAADGGRWERVAAARNLAWLSAPDVVEPLTGLARAEDADVALAGASALATIPSADAYRSLVRLLSDGPLPASRTAAILEESYYQDPLGVLLEEVPDGPPALRFWGAYLAGRTTDPRAFELLARLVVDEDPNVRANAAEALGTLPVDGSVPVLLERSRDEVWYVRAHAARGLGERGDAGVDRLAELLADRSWWVRENAARSLARIGPPSVPALRETLASPDRFARNKAAEVLVGLGFVEREMRTYLEGNGQRGRARESLVLLGRAEALASLSARFLVADDERREALARVLMEIDDPRLQPTLRALVGHTGTGPTGEGAGPRRKHGEEETR